MNYEGIKENPSLREFVAPFPPENLRALMGNVPELAFARKGVRIYRALLEASPVPWEELRVVLDHECGAGRVARLFKDQGKDLHAVDIDRRYIEWYREALPYVKARVVEPGEALPYAEDIFDLIYQVSVLTHVDKETHRSMLEELHRVAQPGGVLLLTVHGRKAIERVLAAEHTKDVIPVKEDRFRKVVEEFEEGRHAFVLQEQHLRTTDEYNYGITFTPPSYIRRNWSRWFDVVEIREGAINNWHDIVVLRAKAEKRNLETVGSRA